MKNKKRIASMMLFNSLMIQTNVFDSIGDSFKNFGHKTSDAFTDLGHKTSDTFKDLENKTYNKVIKPAGDFLKETGMRLEDCAKMLGLGTEWAAQQAALQTAKASLQLAEHSAEGVAFLADSLGKLGAQAINLREVVFEIRASEVIKANLMTVHLKGVLFGKNVDTTIHIDPKNIGLSIEQEFKNIIKKIIH